MAVAGWSAVWSGCDRSFLYPTDRDLEHSKRLAIVPVLPDPQR